MSEIEPKWYVEGYQTGRVIFEGTRDECDFFITSDPYGWFITSYDEISHTIYVS